MISFVDSLRSDTKSREIAVHTGILMDERVAKLTSPEDCERFAKNALDRDRQDLADQARKKAVELRAAAYGAKTEAERQCLEAIYAYEEVLAAKNGRRTRATRTWQMIERHGIIGAV